MKVEVLNVPPEQIRFMDSILLDGHGRMYPLSYIAYELFEVEVIRAWASENSRYGIITKELIDWLLARIGARPTIEIGAGMGDLGHQLGILMTDSYAQVNDPTTVEIMGIMRQQPTRPPPDVVKMDAQTAVLKYKPKVVIASWVTQRWLPGDQEGYMHGPREEEIIKNCDTYIFIGNDAIHGGKRIMKLPHEVYHFPWLVSRARDQSKNVIYIWNRTKL